ncbi:AAA family ATPase [Dactylosporangium aurantiacum]|uniref:AAA family ATPase n=1 Tax=Dactylosporangium aurantiacum TaxID=35754 RepID=UPI002434A23C|nr:AAA family ATPase [Dactylosporangium aurantiacum]MDG6105003.1 CHAT domain-containing protein [Dactylosporangium aurantiacum]
MLRAVDVVRGSRWRWLLTDERTGAALADHPVDFDTLAGDREAEAFRDLYRFLRWNAVPDRRVESEAVLVDRLGQWIGERILGRAVGAAIAAAAPVTVRVQVPDAVGFLLYAPLELAHVGGVPLARRGDVSLVFDIGVPSAPEVAPVGRLRMLAVFSLPTQSSALALRRERYELAKQMRALAARARRMIELEVLQYGVTRQVLGERMTAGGGPDVLHLSGHGGSGVILLEAEDGSADTVDAGDLVRLLRPARGRLRLAVLSACQSAAATTAETLRWLQLDDAADAAQEVADAELTAADEPETVTGLARLVADQVGCAVVAMRYPVVDDFAIALTSALYEGLFRLDLPVDAALRRAVPVAAGDEPSPSRPALSIATPTLFGPAAGLLLTPPRGRPLMDPAAARMAAFLPEPERFVGRTAVMIRASRALASGSGQGGVLLHGMAGAGKTACALELAYRHQDRFDQPVWWQAPLRDEEWPTALTSLALALEAQLGDRGFTMVDKIGTADRLRQFLPRLRAVLRDNGLLIVLDNLETLLTADGGWRDPRWADLVAALVGHGGESRVVLTSRTRPAGLPAGVLVEAVHALSRDEGVLLARELPNLRRLLHAEPGPERATAIETDRARVRRVLHLVQGHPKLLELADRAAADDATLTRHLDAVEHATSGDQTLTAFFADGESALDDAGFMQALTGWTTTAMHTLPDAPRLLLQLLAGTEDDDRLSAVTESVWPQLCRQLELADPVPAVADTLAPLLTAALVEQETIGDIDGDGEPLRRLRLHPGVAEAVRAATPTDVRTAIDTELAAFWTGVIGAWRREGGEHTQTVVRAGLAAAPYLIRLTAWDTAAWAVEQALMRDDTDGVAQAAAAHLHRIAAATSKPNILGTLANAVMRVDVVEGERLLGAALNQAITAGDHRLAAAIATDLVNLFRGSGRLGEALDMADQAAEHSRQAGLGRWTQLTNQVQRLQIVYLLGQSDQVLTEVRRLITETDQLPPQRDAADTVDPFTVREGLLNLGVHAARALNHWQEALDLNTRTVASLRARSAGEHAIAFAMFGDYLSLIRLGRLEDAERLLLFCQQVYEQQQDISALAKTVGARADLAHKRGHHDEAIALAHAALRLTYIRPDPDDIAASHNNLALYLREAGTDPAGQLAHRLAAAIIRQLTGQSRQLATTLRALASRLRDLPDTVVPRTIADLAATVEQVEGVRFSDLVTTLAGEPGTTQQALDTVLHAAHDLPVEEVYDLQSHLNGWEPTLAVLVAAVRGDQDAARALDEVLTEIAGSQDWADLAAVLRRILDGDRDPDTLLTGLDPIDTAIVTRALDAVTGRITLQPGPTPNTDPATQEPWPAIIAAVAAAADGDHAAAADVNPLLDDLAGRDEWAALAAILRRIIAGERDPDALQAGLDPTDTAIAAAVLAQLANLTRGTDGNQDSP